MTTLFTVAGIAIGSELVGKIMEYYGQSGMIPFVKIVAYMACGYVALDAWWDGVRHVAHMFGVQL